MYFDLEWFEVPVLSSQSTIMCAGIAHAIFQLVQDVGRDSAHLTLRNEVPSWPQMLKEKA